jgi:hypothetical protein
LDTGCGSGSGSLRGCGWGRSRAVEEVGVDKLDIILEFRLSNIGHGGTKVVERLCERV